MNALDEFDIECATARERQVIRRLLSAEKNVTALTQSYQDMSASFEVLKGRVTALETRLAWYEHKEEER